MVKKHWRKISDGEWILVNGRQKLSIQKSFRTDGPKTEIYYKVVVRDRNTGKVLMRYSPLTTNESIVIDNAHIFRKLYPRGHPDL